MNTPLIVLCALTVLTGLGVAVLALDALPWGTQTYTVSTGDLASTENLPNTASDLHSGTCFQVQP
jgi:hypothetical protein